MVKDNILNIRERISSASSKIGVPTDSITIVGVSKNRAVSGIKEVIDCGIINIGENKVQEAFLKYNELKAKGVDGLKWHMVGHLQTNKVKEAVKIFDLIHSVDSVRLLEEINKEAVKINKIQDILIEVNTSGEKAKFGFNPDETIDAVKQISEFKNVNIKGLMTVAPIVDNPQFARTYFKLLRELKDQINTLHITHYTLHILSMGMSDDFEIAVEEGSNMLRLGRVIFDGIKNK